jgi:hypothetical protein
MVYQYYQIFYQQHLSLHNPIHYHPPSLCILLQLFLLNLRHALHGIRFRSSVDNIWTVISTNHPELRPNEVSKDISLEPIVIHDLTIKTTIHHTDTVSVIVACSLIPVAADLKGLVRLSSVQPVVSIS